VNGTTFGRYELLRKIAAGGMAEIFLARQWGEGGFFHDVVIKRLFRHMAEHEKTLRMFQYESRLLAELSHPHIPQVFELAFTQGAWYIAMEFVDGHNVADVWRAGARAGHAMPLPVAIGIIMQACEALHHAHERRDRAGRHLRIVHRDVTPQNLMLTRDGVTKVMDFGVAQTAARRDTEAGTVKGTLSYMAPEQVRARPLDKRADVFALGVILYELTTGTRLFRGSDVQIMTAVVEQGAPPPSIRFPEYPKDLEAIVMAALARDRAQRLPSAAHLAMTLEEFAIRHGVLVGPRNVARYVNLVFPYEREKEAAVAMVAPQLEVVGDADSSGAWEEVEDVDISPHDGVDLDDSGIIDDLDLLAPPHSDEVPVDTDQQGRAMPTLPPDAFDDLLDESTSPSSEDMLPPPLEGFDEERGDRPVVLLEGPKRDGTGEGDYVRDLERRLEEEDGDDD